MAPLSSGGLPILRDQPAARRCDAVDRLQRVHHAPREAIQVPDHESADLTADDPLDRLVPQRPVGVSTALVQLFKHVHECESLSLADALDAFR